LFALALLHEHLNKGHHGLHVHAAFTLTALHAGESGVGGLSAH
jgi:hypothetical protein